MTGDGVLDLLVAQNDGVLASARATGRRVRRADADRWSARRATARRHRGGNLDGDALPDVVLVNTGNGDLPPARATGRARAGRRRRPRHAARVGRGRRPRQRYPADVAVGDANAAGNLVSDGDGAGGFPSSTRCRA